MFSENKELTGERRRPVVGERTRCVNHATVVLLRSADGCLAALRPSHTNVTSP
jgi:hypothetical protein